jgi:hypothetical protein
MEKLWIVRGFAALLMTGAPMATLAQSAKTDVKDAGHDTKQAAKDAGHAVKTDTKKGVNKAADTTQHAAGKVKQKTTTPPKS